MNDCSKHKKDICGIVDMKLLAEMIEGSSYEIQPQLFESLAYHYSERSFNDKKNNKEMLVYHGEEISRLLHKILTHSKKMWQISKPFMTKEK